MEQILFSIPLQRLEPILKNWFKEVYLEVEAQKTGIQKVEESKRFLPVPEFCKHANIARQTFYNKAPRGLIPGATQFGRKWFVDIEIFNEYLTSKAVKP